MKMGLLISLVFVLALTGIFCASCISASYIKPYDHGYAVGTAVYAGYAKLSANKSEDFKNEVAAIWSVVNSIDSTDNLATDIATLTTSFDAVLKKTELNESELALAKQLKNMILSRIDNKLSAEALEHKEAVDFLCGVRAGINAMIDCK